MKTSIVRWLAEALGCGREIAFERTKHAAGPAAEPEGSRFFAGARVLLLGVDVDR